MKASRSIPIFIISCLLFLALACHRTTNPVTPENRQSTQPPNGRTTFTGRVIRIADGDTVTVLDAANIQRRIRLQGIDAPESHQAFGTQSKKSLSDMVFDKAVTADCEKTDQYGRLICKILLDGKDIDLEQIKAGLAWHYKEYEREQSPEDRELYARAEDEARAARRGLWTDPNPTEPSEFRRDQRRERETR